MPDKYEEYSRDELLRLIRERDRKPKFGLVGNITQFPGVRCSKLAK